MVMVYYSYSYRRWVSSYAAAKSYFLWDKFKIWKAPGESGEAERAAYDDTIEGTAAPETVFTSASAMRRLTKRWRRVKVYRENVAAYEWIFPQWDRKTACKWFGPICGLDLYCHLGK
jgi:hypothetical protein